jgi:hypothetical protein
VPSGGKCCLFNKQLLDSGSGVAGGSGFESRPAIALVAVIGIEGKSAASEIDARFGTVIAGRCSDQELSLQIDR